METISRQQQVNQIKLSPLQQKHLERKCKNMLNWSDGGHWIGNGKQPNCFLKNLNKNTISHIYRFKTDQDATSWNLEWEKAIRHAGHLGTAILTVAVSAATGGMAGVAAGTIAAIMKDELQAKIPYPRMAKGWSYEIIFENDFKWSPHPWGQRELKQKMIRIIRNSESSITNQSTNIKKYKLSELPDGLGRLIASSPSRKTISDYK